MTIPIDYNKMQAELDRRHYMSQVYISNVETWKPTELGLKTYGKWCDLVGWKNLYQEIGGSSTDGFMNLAIKRKWVERYYSFEEKQNVCSPTKFGHDLFRTFEYWIDEKAQKRIMRKKQINGVMSEFQKVIQGLPKFMQQISAMMASFAPPEESKTKRKKRGTKKTKSNKPKKKQNDTGSYTGDQWQYWSEKWNQERKEWWRM